MFVRSLVNEDDLSVGQIYRVVKEHEENISSRGWINIIDDCGDEHTLMACNYEIINESAPALQSAVTKPNTYELGSLVRILHSDCGDTVKAGQLRRVTEVFDNGIEITVFASDFNSDVQLFFTFDEVE